MRTNISLADIDNIPIFTNMCICSNWKCVILYDMNTFYLFDSDRFDAFKLCRLLHMLLSLTHSSPDFHWKVRSEYLKFIKISFGIKHEVTKIFEGELLAGFPIYIWLILCFYQSFILFHTFIFPFGQKSFILSQTFIWFFPFDQSFILSCTLDWFLFFTNSLIFPILLINFPFWPMDDSSFNWFLFLMNHSLFPVHLIDFSFWPMIRYFFYI